MQITDEMVDAALKAPVSYFLNPNNNLTPEGVRELMRAALVAALGVGDEGMGEGWVEWNGGDNPFGDASDRADIKLRSGRVYPNDWCAGNRWDHQGRLDDIIAYRLPTPPIQGDAK